MTETLPLFPLGSVLFPGVVLPLRVFEDRYRVLVRTLMDAPADEPRRFGVVAIRQGHGSEVGSDFGPDPTAALHPIGCAAELRRIDRHDDGSYDLVTVGVRRFRLRHVDTDSEPYLVGDVDWLPTDEPELSTAGELLAARVGAAFEEYLAAVSATGGAAISPFELPDEPELLSYLVASATLLTLEDRQALLERDNAVDRLRSELTLLHRETVLVSELRAVPVPLSELKDESGRN